MLLGKSLCCCNKCRKMAEYNMCLCDLCTENPERECDENWPRNMEGTWRGNRRDPESSQKFDELVKRKRNEEREKWAKKEGPTSKCDYCNKVPDNKLKTCSRCKLSLYCNSLCQRSHWPIHKLTCKNKSVLQMPTLQKKKSVW